MVTHDDLVASAQRLFPGATVVAEWTYETFRDSLYALVKTDHPDQPTAWRLDALYQLAAKQANRGLPWGDWGRRLFEEELPALEGRLRAAGLLS